MKKKRTDIIILAVLLVLALLIVFQSSHSGKPPASSPASIDVESYDGKPLGVIPGGQYEAVTAQCFPDSTIVYLTGIPELYTALLTKKIDGFVASEVCLHQMQRQNPNVTWLPEILSTRHRYFGFSKTEKGEILRAQMDAMLEEFEADGTMARLEEIWYGDDEALKQVDSSGLTGENGTLHLGVNATDEPYNYMRDGEIVGFNIDIVMRFARRYGYNVTYTETEPQGLFMGLKAGKFDMLATAISYSDERAQSVYFSRPAMKFDVVLAVRAEDTGITEAQKSSFFESVKDSFQKTFIRESRWKMIAAGIGTTCLMTCLSVILGTILAFAICLFRRTDSRLSNPISNLYVKVLQGTPMVVLLMIMYYVVFAHSGLAAIWVAVIGFSLHFGAYISEALRSGINGINAGQREAALALGYTENQAFFHFILPQAIDHILPVYRGEVISLLKGTAVAGYISVQDLTKMSDLIRSRTYEAFFPLVSTAVIYFILAWIIGLLLDKSMARIDPRRRRHNESAEN